MPVQHATKKLQKYFRNFKRKFFKIHNKLDYAIELDYLKKNKKEANLTINILSIMPPSK